MTFLDGAMGAARDVYRQAMVDACRIMSDPEGVADDEIDPATLKLVPPNPDARLVYDGACLLWPISVDAETDPNTPGDQVERYGVAIPWDAERPTRGDQVQIVTSTFSPTLAGLLLVVDEIPEDSLPAGIEMRCIAFGRVPAAAGGSIDGLSGPIDGLAGTIDQL